MSLNLVTLLYLVASVCFIQALKGLSHPTTSLRGNLFGMAGMAIAVLTTVGTDRQACAGNCAAGLGWVLRGLVVGGGYGAWRAKHGRDDQDARAGCVHALHDRPGGGVYRDRSGR